MNWPECLDRPFLHFARVSLMPSATVECVAGAVAGVAQDALMHPVDTLRARLDVTSVARPAPRDGLVVRVNPLRELRAAARWTLAREGVRGLYRGYALAVAGAAPANMLYFGCFKASQRLLGAGDARGGARNADARGAAAAFARDMAAGTLAELCAACWWTPLDVVKQRMQVAAAAGRPADGVAGTVRAVLRERGARGLWAGYLVGIAVWAPFSALYFAIYESLRPRLAAPRGGGGARGGGVFESGELAAGVVAGGAAGLLTQPLDCVKTRVQTGVMGGARDARALLREIVRAEGVGALWRGAAARVLWLAPGCGVMIATFEAAQRVLEGDAGGRRD